MTLPPDAPPRPVPTWWLAALTAVALGLRLVNIDSGLWIDEIDSLVTSFRPSLADIVLEFPRDNRHPFYSVLAHLAIAVFGEHNWVIRLPAVIFGTATVPLLYLLGARLGPPREAFLAATLLAVTYHHVWFSQNARGYAMLGCFAVLGAWLLLRTLDDPRRRFPIGYGAAIALGAWTHLTMVFVAVGHAAACGIAWLARRSRPADAWRRAALAFVLSGIMTLLLYAPVLGDVSNYFRNKPSGLRGISTPLWAMAESGRALAAGLGGAGIAAALIAVAAAGLLFGAGLLSYWRHQRLALGLFCLPGFVTIAGALAARGTMYPRFFFALAPYGVLIAVRGAFALASIATSRRDAIPSARPLGPRIAAAVIGVMIALSLVSLLQLWRYPKQDFEGAQRYAEARRAAGDIVATTDLTIGLYRDFYRSEFTPVLSADDLSRLRAGRRVWLVYVFPRYLARGAPGIFAITERECGDPTVFRGTLGGGDVYVCELGPTP